MPTTVTNIGKLPMVTSSSTRWIQRVCAAVFLALLIGFAVRYMWPLLFRTWFFSSDEYVFAAEAIRFTQGDFRQHFFDMPGTPFMALTALAWRVFYAAHRITGQPAAQAGLGPFTFDHLPALFVLMRATTLLLYGLSIALMGELKRRLFDPKQLERRSNLVVLWTARAEQNRLTRLHSLNVRR